MDEHNDIELVELAKGGHAHALQQLIERHYLTVYRLAYKWCGVQEDAEDIAQEVFVKLVRKLQTFRQKSSFKTWLYRIAVNTAKDFNRKRAAKQVRETAFALDQRQQNPAFTMEDTLAADRLKVAIDNLSLKQKEAVLLVFGEGLSHKEAARTVGCMEATVSWRIFQARKRLKTSLEQGR